MKIMPICDHLKRNESVQVTDFNLDDFLPYQLAVLSNRISDRFARQYQQKFGISVPEWRLVAHLSQEEKVSVREIYKRVEMDKSKVSRAAARLVEAGYVSKNINPADRRLVELSLTAKGRAMTDEISPMGEKFQQEALAALPQQDQEIFKSAIKKMIGIYA